MRLVLQKAADYHGRLQNLSPTMEPEDADQTTEMEAEWTVLRIALVRAINYKHKESQLTSYPGLEGQSA